MMKLLSDEQEREQGRVKKLNSCDDAIEKQELDAKFGVERSRAQKKIERIMREHQQELKALKGR